MGKYSGLTDLELLRKISAQDSRALEELYDRYSTILYTLIKKIVSDERIAEIILVEVFSIIWTKTGKLNFENSSVYTWIVTLTRNRAIDNLRRTKTPADTPDVYDDKYEDYFIIPFLDENIDFLDLKTAVNIRPKMAAAMDKLTDAQKYVLQLSYFQGFTLGEISEKLKLPIEAVRGKMMSAVHNLRQHLLGG